MSSFEELGPIYDAAQRPFAQEVDPVPAPVERVYTPGQHDVLTILAAAGQLATGQL